MTWTARSTTEHAADLASTISMTKNNLQNTRNTRYVYKNIRRNIETGSEILE